MLYVRGQNVLAAPFDLERLEITGPAVPVVSDVRVDVSWSAEFGVSERGELVYVTASSAARRRHLVLTDGQGDERRLRVDAYDTVRVSPGGDRFAVRPLQGINEAWVYDLPRGTMTRLTFSGDAHHPSWTPDGRKIVYSASLDGVHNMFWIAADGSIDAERLTSSPNHQMPGSVSPDGKWLAYTEMTDDAEGWDIRVLPLEGPRESRRFLTTNANEHSPMFSPDGSWLAYVSDESGQSAVYVQPFPGPGPKTRISAAGGSEPVWAPDGRELHYLSTDGTIMSVELHYDRGFRADAAEVRIPGTTVVSLNLDGNGYDVMPDGTFVAIRDDASNRDHVEIRFVVNWFEELKRLAPTKN